jgi:hypothetical protein
MNIGFSWHLFSEDRGMDEGESRSNERGSNKIVWVDQYSGG